MADNVTITPGTGATVAADECPAASGILVQRTKTTWGPDGTANDVDVATGKPMPVQLRGSDGTDRSNALPVTATNATAANLKVEATVASSQTIAVTNAGTFAAQATLSAETTKVIGTVNVTSTQAPSNGQAIKANSTPVVPASDWVYNAGFYVTAGAGATTTLQVTTGAPGDYLDHVVVFPTTTAAGTVAIIDNATTLVTYQGGGTTALLTLTPFTIYIGAVSRSGAWKLTLTSNVTAIAVGRFS